MKYLIVTASFCCLLLASCKTEKEFFKISNEIERVMKKHSSYPLTQKKSLFYNARLAVYKKTQFIIKLPPLDTLYIIESYDQESFVVMGTIWDNNSSVSYQYRKLSSGDEIEILKDSPFSQIQIHLIDDWNIEKIRKEEVSKTNLGSKNKLLASRCYYIKGRMQVDQVSFHDFFDPIRDNLK